MERTPALVLTRSACIAVSLAWPGWACVQADEAADQLERARLLRDLLETRPGFQSSADAPVLPGAKIDPGHPGLPDPLRRQQFEDSRWRNLLGVQQGQIYAPPTQAIPETQWRSQTFDRDRRGEELSADILRRSQQFLSSGHR
jgi:hypothetical protein